MTLDSLVKSSLNKFMDWDTKEESDLYKDIINKEIEEESN